MNKYRVALIVALCVTGTGHVAMNVFSGEPLWPTRMVALVIGCLVGWWVVKPLLAFSALSEKK